MRIWVVLAFLLWSPLADAAAIHYRLVYQTSTKRLIPVLWTTGDDHFAHAESSDKAVIAAQFGLPPTDLSTYEFTSDTDMREQIAAQLRTGSMPSFPGGSPLFAGVLPALPILPDPASVKREAAIARLKAKGIDIQDVKDALSP